MLPRLEVLSTLQKFLLLIAVVSSLRIMYNYIQSDDLKLGSNFKLPLPHYYIQISPSPISVADTTATSRRLTPVTFSHKKWIIVTSISYPTEQIMKLTTIPGWQLLVVADKKTPSNWTYPNVVFLDIDTQLNLGYKIMEFIPWNAYTRKVIGYLYAIQHGAKVIYDTDDDNAPDNVTSFESSFALGGSTSRGLLLPKQNSSAVNPYAHFGQGSIWPRGYPLDLIGEGYNNTYTPCIMTTPIIQQGLVNGDPDVDAIFRLTRKKLHTSLNVQFDPFAPPVFYPKYVAAPFNSQNTIFHYDAFWALLLPVSVAFRVTDIWRGYWAQGLLWKIKGGHLAFYPAHTTQLRNPHTYLKDFEEEDQMYQQTGELVKLLIEWKCSAPDLFGCMIQLTESMAQHGMFTSTEVKLVTAWISDLKSIGYKEPPLEDANNDSADGRSQCLNKLQSHAIFSGVEILPQPNTMQPKTVLRKFCNFTTEQNMASNVTPPVLFPTQLLIVTFNHPHYEYIWLLDSIFRPHFPNILYCGTLPNVSILEDLLETKPFLESSVASFSFVHANVTYGYFEYECAISAINMGYGVSGILLASDDLVLNFWNNGNFDQNQIWQADIKPEQPDLVNLQNPQISRNMIKWTSWWNGPLGLEVTKKALSIIYSETAPPIVQQFRKNREGYGFNSSVAIGVMSDAFYIPASKLEMFHEVALILREYNVFLDIAVTTLISGLSPPENIIYLPGLYLWNNDRGRPMSFFNSTSTFIHPVKFSSLFSNGELKKEYCDKYIAKVLSL